MKELPDLTILLGPQTRVALALNAHLRENRQFLSNRGVTVLPSRLASPLLRRAIDDRPEAERLEEFSAQTQPRPAILSAINMFGPPEAGLSKGELFPDAELRFAGLAPFVGKARIVISIDTLPAFFLSVDSEPFEARVRRTAWEVLYELSWHELLSELVDFLPEAEFLVVTGMIEGEGLAKFAQVLVGPESDGLPAPYTYLRHLISDTGHAVLSRILDRGKPDVATIADLYRSFAVRPSNAELRERLGIDKVTGILLDQRFEEDLVRIAKLPRVTVY